MKYDYDQDNKVSDSLIKTQIEQTLKKEIAQAEKHQIRLEFSTSIIAAHKYCLRNVIHTGQGFECEIIYLPKYKDPNDSFTYFIKTFKVRMLKSIGSIIECREKRFDWGGTGEVYLGPEKIETKTAKGLVELAWAIAATLLDLPEGKRDQESILARLEAENNNNNWDDEGVVKQHEHDHELDSDIAELSADVEIAFFGHRMSK